MTDFEKNLKAAAGKIRLKANEKRELRARVLSYMEYHPLPEPLGGVRKRPQTVKQYFAFIEGWHARAFAGFVTLLIIAGVPAVAERAVPGDVLYPVKVRVNEEVLAQLSMGSYEKMEWEARRVERRIAEARLLAKEGKLTDEVEAQITETVKEHTASAEKELALLRESDADEAQVAQIVLETKFDVQSALLATGATSTTDIDSIAIAVEEATDTLRAIAKDEASRSSYERFLTRTEESIAYSRELWSSIEPGATPEERVQIDRRLAAVGRRVAEAQTLFAESRTKEAIDELKDALRGSERLIAFMTDIDVRESVALDTLVPDEPSPADREALKVSHEEIEQGITEIHDRFTAVGREPEGEVATNLAALEGYSAAIAASIAENGDLASGEEPLSAAKVLLADLLAETLYLTPEEETATTTTDIE